MFGNQSLPSVIYRYGARPPVTGTEEVERQMRLANHYRNKLVEIELERRQEAEAIVMQLAPRLADVERSITATEAAIEAVRGGIRSGRAKTRKLTDATTARQSRPLEKVSVNHGMARSCNARSIDACAEALCLRRRP